MIFLSDCFWHLKRKMHKDFKKNSRERNFRKFRKKAIFTYRKCPSVEFPSFFFVLLSLFSREKWMEHKILLINNYSSFLSPVALIKYWLTIPERSIFHFCLFTTNVQLFLVKFLEFVPFSLGYIFIFHIPATWSNVKVCILVFCILLYPLRGKNYPIGVNLPDLFWRTCLQDSTDES